MAVKLKDYENITGSKVIKEVRLLGEKLKGYAVLHINSTALGGGVAEILKSLTPLMKDVGFEPKWSVMEGTHEFFNVTKLFHNGLHGQQVVITSEMMEVYLATAEKNRHLLDEDADLIVIHDQQPLGLTTYRKGISRWAWYCHIDPLYAVPEVWSFISPKVCSCDLAVFHLAEYARNLPLLQYFMPPAIDPLSEKNREVTPVEYQTVLEKLGIDPDGPPVILQVSRFDRLKDPAGVIQAFKLLRKNKNCRLVLAGGSAGDDPEGNAVLGEIRELAEEQDDIDVLALSPDADLEINVLQRRADIIVQKSLREGFGLTAAEALWKGKPLVVTPTGGLGYQVLHGKTGLAARTVEETAKQIEYLLEHPGLSNRLGAAGKEHVRQNFILPAYLLKWINLLLLLKGRR
ncbi:MAG: Trehalose synthase (ADP-glucose) [Pelotomaculum thermopropionicum]|uniref:Trehalose synthase (ADP-glucose) n=1 Tax=Pelotomaculum thermopropionicum TaxID=110500 RepID=A0A124FYX7_9FIRM|nr:MAG: Trehalose synthase (ADP-glucose) [Pelotomaculum thermopropionicum]